MQLFYAPDVTLPLYTLNEEESKHCVRVLRLREGDTLHLTDGRGSLYLCRVVEAHQHHCFIFQYGYKMLSVLLHIICQ